MTLQAKKIKSGPRKLLALDGGGIRGMISIEILAKIESMLQKELGRDDTFVLAEYFDYISGTSTGAIIASLLAIGLRVDDIRNFYITCGKSMFHKSQLLLRLNYKYLDDHLSAKIQDVVGKETLLGSDKLKTYLMLVLRNATTDSPWPLSNNPEAKYNKNIDNAECNLTFPLWQLIRASTAAPTFFPPEVIDIGAKKFVFVDGGVTMYNNPAFQLFLMATVEPYNLNWSAGIDNMLLVSVGTGYNADANKNLHPEQMNLVFNASKLPAALMFAAQSEQDLLCRIFGDCRVGESIDSEIGDMIGKRGPIDPKLFTYLRYNGELSQREILRLGLSDVSEIQIQPMDSVEHIVEISKFGQAVASAVMREHFSGFLQN